MADLESILNLAQDAEEAAALVREHGGALFRDELERGTYWLTLRPPAAPGEEFYARLAWHTYPGQPPSIKFADCIGGRVDLTSAWPIAPGFRPGDLDICKPISAEGFTVHPEWVNGPEAWQTTGNPLAYVVSQLIADITNGYGGRSQ